MSTLSQEDKDTNEFFAEVEKDKKAHYEKCSAIDAFDAVFNCYSNKQNKTRKEGGLKLIA